MKLKTIFLGLLTLAFVVNGCGGGGGSVNELTSAPSSSQMQKLDDNNAKKNASSSIESALSSKMLVYTTPALDLKLHNKIVQLTKKVSLKENRTIQGMCQEGSITVNDNGNSTGTIKFNNCKLHQNFVYNGTIEVLTSKVDDDGNIKELKAKYHNFSVKTSFSYSIIRYAEVSRLQEQSKETLSISKLYAVFERNNKTSKFHNFNLTVQTNESSTQTTTIYTAKGYVKAFCSNGYVYIETLPQIKEVVTDDSSAFYGKVKISSLSKSVVVECDNDTVTITNPSGQEEVMNSEQFRKTKECN